jgi:hypothetical protein
MLRLPTLYLPDQLLPALLQVQQFLAILGAQIDDPGHSPYTTLDPLELEPLYGVQEFPGKAFLVALQIPGRQLVQV